MMCRKFLLLCCLALGVSGKSLTYTRIVDGKETTIEKFPYSVALFKFGGFFCGGSIISEEWVLTAGHCVGAEIAVAGQTDPYEQEKSWAISEFIAHPKYPGSDSTYDMGLLKLKEKLPLDGITMKAVKLAAEIPKTGEPIDIAGWGLLHSGDLFPPNTLRTAENSVFSFPDCKKIYGDNLGEGDICLNDPKSNRNACNGDSGSAAIDKNGYQVGITSRGKTPCGQPNIPNIYTAIAHPENREFIRKHTGL